jgi:hypothetical protein
LISVPLVGAALFLGVALWSQRDVLRPFAPLLVDLGLPLKALATPVFAALLALVLAVLCMRTHDQQNRAAMFKSVADCRQRAQLTFKDIRSHGSGSRRSM